MFPPSAAEPVVHSGTLSDSVHFCWTVYVSLPDFCWTVDYRIFVGRHIAGLASAVEARLLPSPAVCWPASQEIQTGPPLYATDMDCNVCPKSKRVGEPLLRIKSHGESELLQHMQSGYPSIPLLAVTAIALGGHGCHCP